MSIEQSKSEYDYYGLFLDPESRIYFRKIFGRDDFIRIEPLDDMDDAKEENDQIMTGGDEEADIRRRLQTRNTAALVELT